MAMCEECFGESPRRTLCPCCGQKICGWCVNHTHNYVVQGVSQARWEEMKKAQKLRGA